MIKPSFSSADFNDIMNEIFDEKQIKTIERGYKGESSCSLQLLGNIYLIDDISETVIMWCKSCGLGICLKISKYLDKSDLKRILLYIKDDILDLY